MKTQVFNFLLSSMALLASILAIAANPNAAAPIDAEACPFSEHRQFTKTTCEIRLYNRTAKPYTITRIEPVMPEDQIKPGTLTIPANGFATVIATIDMSRALGASTHRFRTWNESKKEGPAFSAKFFVTSLLDNPIPQLDLGTTTAGETPQHLTWNVTSKERLELAIDRIIEKPDFIDVDVDAGGHDLTITQRPDTDWGQHAGIIKLRTNTTEQPEFWVWIRSNVLGRIAANVGALDFGIVREGTGAESLLQISSRDGKPFSITNVQVEGFVATVAVSDCLGNKSTACQSIKVIIPATQSLEMIKGTLIVAFKDKKPKLLVGISGLMLDKTTEVRDLNEIQKQSEAKSGGQSPAEMGTAESKQVDLASTLKNVVHAEDEPPPPGTGPLVRWAVAHEAGIYGYLIYRANAKEGPFGRINKDTIAAKNPFVDNESRYQWRDTSAIKGNTYWYIIGVVYGDGTKKDLTDAVKAVAK